jgi:hypothetical protein
MRLPSILMVAALCLPQWAAAQTVPATKPAVPFTIGKDTTLLTSPLKPDGTIDYVAAINQTLSQNVTPDNNAFVPLIAITGTSQDMLGNHADEVLKMVGAQASPGTWKPLPRESFRSDDDEIAALDARRAAETAPWHPRDHANWAQWLDGNTKSLNAFDAAVGRPRYWVPLVYIAADDQTLLSATPPHGSCSDIIQALHLRAMREPIDATLAWKDLFACHKYCRLLTQSPEFIDLLFAATRETTTCDAELMLIRDEKTSPKLLRRMITDLAALAPIPTVSEVMRRKEIYNFPDAIQQLALTYNALWQKAGDSPEVAQGRAALEAMGFHSPDWDRMLRYGNSIFADLYADHKFASPAEADKWQSDFDHRIDTLMEESRAGKPENMEVGTYLMLPRKGDTQAIYSDRIASGIVTILFPAVGTAGKIVAIDRKRTELSMLACSLELYYRDHNAYPDSLDALLPKYATAIPVNLLDKPLDFSHAKTSFHLACATVDPSSASKSKRDQPIVIDISH